MYQLNLSLSESLYPLLCTFEIVLRNKISNVLTKHYGETWFDGYQGKWFNGETLPLATFNDELDTIKKAKDNIIKKKGYDYNSINSDVLVAELTFGFWTGMMRGSYERKIWQHYVGEVFENYPHNYNLKREFPTIRKEINRIRDLRNRIFHYEPLFGTNKQYLADLIFDYYNAKKYLKWLSEDAASFLESQDKFPEYIKWIPDSIINCSNKKIRILDKNILKYFN